VGYRSAIPILPCICLAGLAGLSRYQTRLINDCYYLFSVGIILFSGSLYLLATRELIGWEWLNVIGPVTQLAACFLLAMDYDGSSCFKK